MKSSYLLLSQDMLEISCMKSSYSLTLGSTITEFPINEYPSS